MLLSFINYENQTRYRPTSRSHDLSRFARLLKEAGWQPGAVSTIHIGGTNAKGSVGWLLERILRHGGMRTGLFSSPHLLSMRERVRLSGKPISRSAFRKWMHHLVQTFPGEPGAGFRTTFEHLTALAFLWFQAERVDHAILEVGLGGRLDATNVIPPGLAVITPISLDHGHILGSTVAAIARDKSHILKSGGKAFIMPQTRQALEPIRRRLRRLNIPSEETSERVGVVLRPRARTPGMIAEVCGLLDYGPIPTRLIGEHQQGVIAAAVRVAEVVLPRPRLAQAVRGGLREVLVPGRLEVRSVAGQRYLLDGGHNPAAGRAVARAVAGQFGGQQVVAIVGMAADKDHRGYLNPLATVVRRFVFTAARNPRAADPHRLAGKTPVPSETAADLDRAIRKASHRRPDLILIGGSFLVVAEAMTALDRVGDNKKPLRKPAGVS